MSRGVSPNTIRFYRDELGLFSKWVTSHRIATVGSIQAEILREYFKDLADRRNKGGVHTSFRAIKALLNWLEIEEDGEYNNPIHKVKVPGQKSKPLPGVSIEHIQKMMDACHGPNEQRDKTILRCLLDTGARGFEFVALSLSDINLNTGAVIIEHGKGDKERTVYIGATSRRSLKRYLRGRSFLNLSAPLWLTDEGDRLKKKGLYEIVSRRADNAGIPTPGLHDFRRAFALNMWRSGVDILAISRLMGHSSTTVTSRYIADFGCDLRNAHAKGSPVDNADL